MFEVTRSIISNPIWTTTATIVSWFLFYHLFKWTNLSEKNWKKLEYLWIFTGLIGTLSVVERNNKDFNSFEAYWAKKRILNNLLRINYFLGESISCREYVQAETSPPDLIDRQFDQNQICFWSKKYVFEIDSAGVPLNFLETQSINKIQFRTDFMAQYVKEFLECCNDLNQEISNYRDYKEKIQSDFFDDFNRSFGILLLIVAAGIKLSITTNSIKNSSESNSGLAKKQEHPSES